MHAGIDRSTGTAERFKPRQEMYEMGSGSSDCNSPGPLSEKRRSCGAKLPEMRYELEVEKPPQAHFFEARP
jgi:hypothetical protein